MGSSAGMNFSSSIYKYNKINLSNTLFPLVHRRNPHVLNKKTLKYLLLTTKEKITEILKSLETKEKTLFCFL